MIAQVLYGPPGTGKTRQLTAEVLRLLQKGIDIKSIVVCSFTKAAAKEIASRVAEGIKTATLHSLCFGVCDLSKDQVIGPKHLRQFTHDTGIMVSEVPEPESTLPGDIYLSMLSFLRARKQDVLNCDFIPGGSLSAFRLTVDVFTQWKAANGYVDFTDMLELALTKPVPEYDYMIVDEAQDLSPLQWEVLQHWATGLTEITVAGDDDQSIYAWGGADPQGMLKFEKRNGAKRRVLTQSYRVPKAIHNTANRLIQTVANRVPKQYDATPEEGAVHRLLPEHIGRVARHGQDTLILYRCHEMRKGIESELIAAGVPYHIEGKYKGPLQSAPAVSMALTRKLLAGMYATDGQNMLTPKEEQKLLRGLSQTGLYLYKNGQHKSMTNWPLSLKASPKTINFLLHIDKTFGLNVAPTVRLSTIHGAKGWEADTVILYNGLSRKVAENMFNNGPDDEKRVFYVGMTRAKKRLFMLDGPTPLAWWLDNPRW